MLLLWAVHWFSTYGCNVCDGLKEASKSLHTLCEHNSFPKAAEQSDRPRLPAGAVPPPHRLSAWHTEMGTCFRSYAELYLGVRLHY